MSGSFSLFWLEMLVTVIRCKQEIHLGWKAAQLSIVSHGSCHFDVRV